MRSPKIFRLPEIFSALKYTGVGTYWQAAQRGLRTPPAFSDDRVAPLREMNESRSNALQPAITDIILITGNDMSGSALRLFVFAMADAQSGRAMRPRRHRERSLPG